MGQRVNDNRQGFDCCFVDSCNLVYSPGGQGTVMKFVAYIVVGFVVYLFLSGKLGPYAKLATVGNTA